MPPQLTNLQYARASFEPCLDGVEASSADVDVQVHGCLQDPSEAEERLRNAQRRGDSAGVLALCDHLAHNYSAHLLDRLSWANLPPDAGDLPRGENADPEGSIASFDTLTQQFLESARSVQGAGWAVLAWHPTIEQLVILQTEKHQNLEHSGVTPILALDVWDDAYYLWLLRAASATDGTVYSADHAAGVKQPWDGFQTLT